MIPTWFPVALYENVCYNVLDSTDMTISCQLKYFLVLSESN